MEYNHIKFIIHGVKLLVKSKDMKFMKKVFEEYKDFISEFEDIEAHIDVCFNEYKVFGSSEKEEIVCYNKVATNLYVNKNKFIWKTKNIVVKCDMVNRIQINATYYERIDHTIRKIINPRIEHNNYNHLVRVLVHYPLITHLGIYKNMDVIHASTVEKDGRAFLFAGFNGAGKSSLAAYLHFERGYNVLADNFTLIDEENAYSFPESLRISQNLKNSLNLNENNEVFGKVKIATQKKVEKAKISYLFLLQINNCNETIVRKISKEEFYLKILNIHNHIAEFPNYSYFTALPFVSGDYLSIRYNKQLKELIKSVELYEVLLGKDQAMESIVKILETEVCLERKKHAMI